MPASSGPTPIVLALLLSGCAGPVPETAGTRPDSAAVAPRPTPQVPGPAMRPAPRPTPPAPPPVVVSESNDDAMAPASPLERECLAHRASGSKGRAGEARFAMDRPDPRFRPRSAALMRQVLCGFRGGQVFRTSERIYLRLASQDRDDPGFSTGDPNNSSRYYVVCEGSLRTTLAAFRAGQRLSFADNTFTLPCGHLIYPRGVSNPDDASRISGAYVYKVRSATLRVRQGPSGDRPDFDMTIDVVVANPIETLELRGRLSGQLSTSVVVVECGTQPSYTKQVARPPCG